LSDYLIYNAKKAFRSNLFLFAKRSGSSRSTLQVPEEDTAVVALAQGDWEWVSSNFSQTVSSEQTDTDAVNYVVYTPEQKETHKRVGEAKKELYEY